MAYGSDFRVLKLGANPNFVTKGGNSLLNEMLMKELYNAIKLLLGYNIIVGDIYFPSCKEITAEIEKNCELSLKLNCYLTIIRKRIEYDELPKLLQNYIYNFKSYRVNVNKYKKAFKSDIYF